MLRPLAASFLQALPWSLQYPLRASFGVPKRYRNIIKTVRAQQSRSILEVGVYRGTRSEQMIKTALMSHPASEVRYYGFDLFEGLNQDLLKSEFSKIPAPEKEIQAMLEKTGASIRLIKGFSQETLPAFLKEWKEAGSEPIDFAFIDGGHAEETIASDWHYVSQMMGPRSIVIFDDYYSEDYSPHIGRVGCQYLIDALDRSVYDVEILEPQDAFAKAWGTLRIKLAKATLKASK
jgi:hypothetical protein